MRHVRDRRWRLRFELVEYYFLRIIHFLALPGRSSGENACISALTIEAQKKASDRL